MSRFDREYAMFCDDIADYLASHEECHDMIEWMKRHRLKMVSFTDTAFRIWRKDRDRLGWYIENQRQLWQGERGSKA